MSPNIFEYATKELSQDAFFGWLLAWGDEKYTGTKLNTVSLAFINFLLSLHNKQKVISVSIKIHMQHHRADIVAEVGSNSIILIEDKVNANDRAVKLKTTLDLIRSAYPGRDICAIYLKTGDQSNYDEMHEAGFALCLRDQILKLLEPWNSEVSNIIFNDYISYILVLSKSVESYAHRNVDDWTQDWNPWIGFYKCLQRRMPYRVEWKYVHNQRGGFLGAWWLFQDWTDPETGRIHSVYLQIEHGPLCFKIEVAEGEPDRAGVRNRWHSILMKAASRSGFEIFRPAKMGNGTWMTVAILKKEKWIFKKNDELIDLEKTLSYLTLMTQLVLDAALLTNIEHDIA
jgi:hypothetical protein